MIPLDAGDYFIYYPSAAAKEEKLPESVSGTADAPEIKVGFIAYYAGDKKEEGLTFSSGVLTYHLHETATDIPAAGVLFGKLMCVVTHGKVNPLIGSAGVSAVPMAARVSQKVGSEADPTNFLLMHAMGPNVAGVIGTAVAAGTFMAIFGI